jgi:hypothetical protein
MPRRGTNRIPERFGLPKRSSTTFITLRRNNGRTTTPRAGPIERSARVLFE